MNTVSFRYVLAPRLTAAAAAACRRRPPAAAAASTRRRRPPAAAAATRRRHPPPPPLTRVQDKEIVILLHLHLTDGTQMSTDLGKVKCA